MNDRVLLTATALVYFAASLAFLFAGQEVLAAAGAAGTPVELTLLQVLGAAQFSLAMLNWLSRHSRIGGIFGRPLVVANFTNGVVAALMLLHAGRRFGFRPVLVLALGLHGLVALGFAAKLFGRPAQTDTGPAVNWGG